jgi:hypothetical protein
MERAVEEKVLVCAEFNEHFVRYKGHGTNIKEQSFRFSFSLHCKPMLIFNAKH